MMVRWCWAAVFLCTLFAGFVAMTCPYSPTMPLTVANPPAVYVPTYSAQYHGDDAILRDILAELRAIRQLLQRQQTAAERPPESLKALFAARCAACHTAPANASDFVLIDVNGGLAPLSVQEKRRIMREVEAERMPKPPKGQPLSELEKASLKKFLYQMEDKP